MPNAQPGKAEWQDELFASHTDQILHEQIRLLCSYSPLSLLTAQLLAAFTTFILWPSAAGESLVAWLAGLTVIHVLRAWWQWRYRCSRPDPAALPGWRRKLVLGAAASGCLWGASALLIITAPAGLQLLLLAVLVAVATGATVDLFPLRAAAVAFVVPALLPLSLLWVTGDASAVHPAVALLPLLYLVLLLVYIQRSHAASAGELALRFEKGDLLARLLQEVDARKGVQEALEAERLQVALVLEHTGDAVITLDEDLRVEHLNPVAELLVGQGGSNLQGRLLGEIPGLDRQGSPSLMALVQDCLGGDAIRVAGQTLLMGQPEIGFFACTALAAPLRNLQGGLVGVTLVLRLRREGYSVSTA